MAEIIDFEEYKVRKGIDLNGLTKEEMLEAFESLSIDDDCDYEFKKHKSRYIEAYINMDEEEKKMIRDWLLDDM